MRRENEEFGAFRIETNVASCVVRDSGRNLEDLRAGGCLHACLRAHGVFFARCCLGKSRAERPSVSYTKVTARSQGQAISCNYTNINSNKLAAATNS